MPGRLPPSGPFNSYFRDVTILRPVLENGEKANVTGVALEGVQVGDAVAAYPSAVFSDTGHMVLGVTPTASGIVTVAVGNFANSAISSAEGTLTLEVRKK